MNMNSADHLSFDAIIFDLFGTLVNSFSARLHDAALCQMATALRVPYAGFMRGWIETTWPMRVLGTLASVEDNVLYVCRELGVDADGRQVAAATEIMLEFTRAGLVPRQGACEVLTALSAAGYKIGLISDCAPAVPRIWMETPFATLIDAAVFSCDVHLQKPDPRIYQLTCARLGVQAQRCLYAGDGSSHELSGAKAMGMTAVLVSGANNDYYDTHRPDVEGWDGLEIASLTELLALVRLGQ
jgi:putative hydrolase of the HAD superfamily